MPGERREFRCELEDGKIVVYCYYFFSSLVKEIPGHDWDPVRKAWLLPLNAETLERIRGVRGAQISGKIAEAIGMDYEPAPDPIPQDAEEFAKRLPVKANLYKHQIAAAKRALEVFS